MKKKATVFIACLLLASAIIAGKIVIIQEENRQNSLQKREESQVTTENKNKTAGDGEEAEISLFSGPKTLKEEEIAAAESDSDPVVELTAAEKDLFARLVHAEAGGEPYEGQVAVAATVLNRLESSNYPDSISEIIYQIESGRCQYSPVLDGRINLPPGESAEKAVEDALQGSDPTGGATGFYNPAKTANTWVRRKAVTKVIGSHIFFR